MGKEIKAAVAAGNAEALAQLLTRTDELDEKLVQDLLFRAARSGHGEIMETLLDDERVEIDLTTIQDENGQNLLHAAVASRSAELVEESYGEEVIGSRRECLRVLCEYLRSGRCNWRS